MYVSKRKGKMKKIKYRKALANLKPSEFMRGRRPELFSDTKSLNKLRLSREVFEYHINTLTNRKQEIDFEIFCRRLAEKEICPNLIPQTGPTGGGDSGVDTETYPVSDEIAIRWHEGIGIEASKERWGFAFSAKKKWKEKVEQDVKKIACSKRNYKKIFFISNQFIKDKDRSIKEEELKSKYKIYIRIMDRSWIVNRVFKNEHFQLAIDTLHLADYDINKEEITGPKDAERRLELEELTSRINDPERYTGSKYILAEDCLQVALLVRGLELPRTEVENYFNRALNVAKTINNKQQLLRMKYEKAWTIFWWYEDIVEFNNIYDDVEKYAKGSFQAADLQLLTNLWFILNSSVSRKVLTPAEACIEKRSKVLKSELRRLIADKRRPNNALHAKSNLLLIELEEEIGNPKYMNSILKKFKKIVENSNGLVDFPFDTFRKIIIELGEFLSDSSEYEKLFEAVAKVLEKRISEGEVGKLLLERGFQELNKGKNYAAIKLFGRAQTKLAKNEYKEDLIQTFIGIGLAYEAVGLLWAARSSMLLSANIRLSEMWKYGFRNPKALPILQKLVWIELQLGRVTHVLSWIELASIFSNQFDLDDEIQSKIDNQLMSQDFVFGILFLKTELWKLKSLEFMPKVLEKLGLPYSQMALLYALGHEDLLRKAKMIHPEETQKSIREFFWKWFDQPANEDLPKSPELLDQSEVMLYSIILGCKLVFRVENNLQSIYLAETILAVLEAFLATSLDAHVYPYKSGFSIKIYKSEFVTGIPKSHLEQNELIIRHAPINYFKSTVWQEDIHSWLIEIIGEIVQNIALIDDPKVYLDQLAKEEEVFGRISNFYSIPILIENIFGNKPKFKLSDWLKLAESERYHLDRRIDWNNGLSSSDKNDRVTLANFKKGKGKPPANLLDIDHLKHRDRRVFSFINIPLWDKAKWHGVGYFYTPERTPFLTLIFKNREAVISIFREWRSRLGSIDSQEELRISIIKGVNKANPSFYRVVIGVNPILKKKGSKNQFIVVSRILSMEPNNSQNLDNFIKRYKQAKKFILLPGFVHDLTKGIPEVFHEFRIEKQKLQVIQAWQISQNDLEVVAINSDDDPIIPSGISKPPIYAVLKKKKKKTKARKPK